MFRTLGLCSALALAAALSSTAPAAALSMQECSAKYQDAKKNDTLKGMKWNDFRKAECSDEDASEADAAAAEKEAEKPAPKPTAGQKTPPASTTTTETKTADPKTADPKPTLSGKVAYPSAVSSKYSSETPGKARMHTCLDQYRANKEKGAEQPNWIMKGGGYYSQCNAKLKDSGA